MNASALLKSQGWRGKGHTLHATDNSIGLTNPLLLSRNTDGKGLGANKTFTDQWWLAAFDEKLKGLDVTKTGVVQTVTTGALNAVRGGGGKYSGLYASFVRGGLMEGTLEDREGPREESTDATPDSDGPESVSALRKRVVKGKDSKEERRKRREAKAASKQARAERAAAKEQRRRRKQQEGSTRPGKDEETKEQRRARRTERRARKEARRKRREERAARKAAKG